MANERVEGAREGMSAETTTNNKLPYEAPRLLKKRSVARVTLFSSGGGGFGGTGAAGSGLTSQ